MQALAIVALIFASLSIVIPVGGIYIPLLCSLMALISFRSQTTLSGVTFGINIINAAFLSPILYMSDMHASGELDINNSALTATGESGELYWTFVGYHLVMLTIAIIWRIIRGAPAKPVNNDAA